MKKLIEYINESVMSIDDDQRKAVYELLTEISDNKELQEQLKSYSKNKKVLDGFKKMLSYWVK